MKRMLAFKDGISSDIRSKKENDMNIMIHGAVNGSNFGDILYAQIYNDYIKSFHTTGKVCFWEHFRFGASKHLKSLTSIDTEKKLDEVDVLVYMPGGYFGGGVSIPRIIKQDRRYFRLGRKLLKKKKKILVSAIGGERTHYEWLRKRICHILQNAEMITTRNIRTAEFYQPYTNTKIIPLFDVILHVGKMDLGVLPPKIMDDVASCGEGQKKIFLHVHAKDAPNREFEKRVLPAVNRYVEETGAHVFVGSDYVSDHPIEETSIYRNLKGSKSVYKYTSPLELCAMLGQCDLIVTPKLHVGVVSAALGKSVVSTALWSDKTKAFYEDIGCAERSVALKDATPEIVYENLVRFGDTPITIPAELVERAEENLVLLRQTIETLASGNDKK